MKSSEKQNIHSSQFQEQDKSSDIEQQPPFGDRKISNIQPPNRRGGYKTNRTFSYRTKTDNGLQFGG